MKILTFKATPGFGQFKQLFTKNSVKHPAKINLNLLKFLIENYTEAGEIILDPMAGTFSTSVMATILGRNSIGVELEKRFVDWGRQNIELANKHPTLNLKGKAIAVQGDSRQLSELLQNKIDSIITSPPYDEGIGHGGGKTNICDEKKLYLRGAGSYSESKENIGNLRSTDKEYEELVDSIITSPPYANISVTSYDSPDWTKYFSDMLKEKGYIEWGGKRYTEKEWRRMNHGRIDGRTTRGVPKGETGYDKKVDSIITSVPYSDSVTNAGEGPNTPEFWKWAKDQAGEWPIPNDKFRELSNQWQRENKGYSPDDKNIGNLKHGEVDAVITSPPYHDNKSDWDRKSNAAREGEEITYSDEIGKARENIGNIHYYDEGEPLSKKYSKSKGSETYLEAMQKVYAEMYQVLKPNGKAIIVLKNFIRNKKVVYLTDHTIKLMESIGFKLHERLKFKLPTKSFWRTIYSQKYPKVDVSDLEYEHILIFRKP